MVAGIIERRRPFFGVFFGVAFFCLFIDERVGARTVVSSCQVSGSQLDWEPTPVNSVSRRVVVIRNIRAVQRQSY